MAKCVSGVERLAGSVNRFIGDVAGVAVLLLIAVTVFEMLSRYVFGRPTTWSLDVSRYLLLLVGVLSLPYTLQEDGHVNFGVVVEHLPSRLRRGVDAVAALLALGFCGVLAYYSVKLGVVSYRKSWGTMAHASIPEFYLYGVIALSALALCVTFLLRMTRSPASALELEEPE